MGSIQNLLNPLNTLSPQRQSASSTRQNNNREPDSPTLSLAKDNAANSSPAPSTLRIPPAVAAKQQNSNHAGYVMESIQAEPMQRTSSGRGKSSGAGGTVVLGEIRVLSRARGIDGAGGSLSDAGPGNRSRRTSSSSSLADLLNPVESSSVIINVSSSLTQGAPEKSSSSAPRMVLSPAAAAAAPPPPPPPRAHHPPAFVVSPVLMEEIDENDEDMQVDIVGVDDETPAAILNGATTTAIALQSEPMQKSKSTDSERTIDGPATSLPLPKPSTPTPIPSRKRKCTPESSPDEPIAHEFPPQLETSSSPLVEPTISIEKIPATPKAAKKSRKTLVKRSPSVKKKQAVHDQKKRPPSAREKSESVDDVSFSCLTNDI